MPLHRVVIGSAVFLPEVRDGHAQPADVVILLDFDSRLALQDHAFIWRLLGIDDQGDARIVFEAFVFERGLVGMKRYLAALVFVPGRHRMRGAIGRGHRKHRDMRLRKELIDFLLFHRHGDSSSLSLFPFHFRGRGEGLGQRPWNFGLRFSRNARVPSRTSSDGLVIITLSAASSSAFSSVISRCLYIMRLARRTASGGPSARRCAKSFTRASNSACGTTSVTRPSSYAFLAS